MESLFVGMFLFNVLLQVSRICIEMLANITNVCPNSFMNTVYMPFELTLSAGLEIELVTVYIFSMCIPSLWTVKVYLCVAA